MESREKIVQDFQKLFAESPEEKIETRAHILSLIFLSETEKAMDRKDWTKKRLAQEIGTSASYLTQLFRGDRLLNFKTIAKIEAALDIHFEITASESQKRDVNYSDDQELNLKPVQVNESEL